MTRRRWASLLLALRLAAAARVVPVVVRAGLAARRPDPPPPVPPRSEGPSISVIVPARDEAGRIGPLLDALVDAPGVHEVIVVDDGSSDDTAELAAAAGAHVVPAGAPPSGWAGKTWALDQGVRSAAGEWIVCLDADTRPAPELPRWLVARACHEALDLVSVTGVADLPPAARWLHASMLATLVYRFGGPGAGGRGVVNGQCLAFRRDELVAAGGLSSVSGAVTEDVALARALARRGWRVALIDAGDRLVVEPYADLRGVWHGWGRSIGLPGVEPRARVVADGVALALTMVVPGWRLARRTADVLDLALAAMRFGTLAGMRRAYRAAGPGYWCSPLADPIAVSAVVASACRRSVSWRGRRLPVVAVR